MLARQTDHTCTRYSHARRENVYPAEQCFATNIRSHTGFRIFEFIICWNTMAVVRDEYYILCKQLHTITSQLTFVFLVGAEILFERFDSLSHWIDIFSLSVYSIQRGRVFCNHFSPFIRFRFRSTGCALHRGLHTRRNAPTWPECWFGLQKPWRQSTGPINLV